LDGGATAAEDEKEAKRLGVDQVYVGGGV